MENSANAILVSEERTDQLAPGTYAVAGGGISLMDVLTSYAYACRTRRSDAIKQPWLRITTADGTEVEISVMELAVNDKPGFCHRLGGKVRRVMPEGHEKPAEAQWFKGEYDLEEQCGKLTVGTEPVFDETKARTPKRPRALVLVE